MTVRPIILAAMLVLSGCMTPAPDVSRSDMLTIQHDPGGNVAQRRSQIGALIFDDRRIAVRGTCASACTMYLVLGPDRVCTTPNARWGFHSARNPRTGAMGETGTRELVAMYPPRLQAWFWQNAHGKTGSDLAWLTGAQMIANGFVREC